MMKKERALEGRVRADIPEHLVGLARVELATSRLSGVRSNHLSYRPPPIEHSRDPEVERAKRRLDEILGRL